MFISNITGDHPSDWSALMNLKIYEKKTYFCVHMPLVYARIKIVYKDFFVTPPLLPRPPLGDSLDLPRFTVFCFKWDV